jgi:hypothetical protein
MPKGIPKAGHRKPGAGKPKGQPTTTIAFRVPVQHQDRIKVMVKNYLKSLTPISEGWAYEKFKELNPEYFKKYSIREFEPVKPETKND